MLLVVKDAEIVSSFNQWAQSENLKRWEEYSAPDSQYYQHYSATRSTIASNEQDSMSAYTEKPLSSKIHIDHFRKRSLYPRLTFDYTNFYVDDVNDNYGACYKDNRAGVAIDTYEGEKCIFCPITDEFGRFTEYMEDGCIKPKDGLSDNECSRVKETIRVFNLNHSALKSMRCSLIEIVREYCGYQQFSEDEIRNCMRDQGFPSVVDWALSIYYK